MGDLEEEFQNLVDSSGGLRGASRWYWQQVWECCKGTAAPKAQESRDSSGQYAGLLKVFRRNLRYALRSLAKAPAFTAAAVITLAIGIGPNTTIFSIVDAVLLRPLPFRDSQRHVVLWETDRSDGNRAWRVTPADYKDWKGQADAFEDLTALAAYEATLTGRGEPVQVKGAAVTANYFTVLGVLPILGRAFQPADEASGAPVVVAGYDFWQSRLGGSESAIGSSLILDGAPMTVIGVMPAGIYPSWPVNGPRMYFQSEYQDVWILFPSTLMNNRRSHVLGVVGRLKQGVSLQAARHQMDTIAARLEKEYADDKDQGVVVRPLMDEVAGDVRPALLILLSAVGSVLLIACSNVAGLLLGRFTSRRHEIAVRTALGAGSPDLLSQFFLEGLLMALLAGAVGILFAGESLHALLRLVPQDIPRLAEAHLDARVLAFTLGISFLASILFSLAPAWTVLRLNLSGELNETSRGNEGLPSQRLRQALVVAQVSMAVVLTVSAGLLAQSFWRLKQIDPRFNARHLLVAELVLPDSKYDTWQKIANFYRQLLKETARIPGVLSTSLAYDHPLEANWLSGFSIHGKPGKESWTVQLRIVSPGYFSNVDPALMEGREFRDEEDNTRPGVAIVNESFKRRYFPEGKALGRTILCTAASTNWKGQMPDRFEIVGVVADVQAPGLNAKTEPYLYISSWQFPRWEM
ncbi:MAG TPA: ABC transporter permease, partial [Acidobacteriota bacterium]|nr:ABC transporter permease [Acidobacteriota bacterium]